MLFYFIFIFIFIFKLSQVEGEARHKTLLLFILLLLLLLLLYTLKCENCKKLLPSYDILAIAVEGESNRIIIAKIDLTLNDIPLLWLNMIKNNHPHSPSLLWFPAKDKPYNNNNNQDNNKIIIPVPKPYWDSGYSLYELISFIKRENSFNNMKTILKIATIEKLGSLINDEIDIKNIYDKEEKIYERNEGRYYYNVLNKILLNILFLFIYFFFFFFFFFNFFFSYNFFFFFF